MTTTLTTEQVSNAQRAALDLLNALKVILLTEHIADYLSQHDPMALRQVATAVAKAEPFHLTNIYDARVQTFGTIEAAHAALRFYAETEGLDVHLHAGGWAGNAISTAYPVGGDSLVDAVAVVKVVR